MPAQHGPRATTSACRRTLRQALDTSLPILGIVVILSAVLCMQEFRGHVALVVLGILLIEVGVWKLAHQVLPTERTSLALRGEVELFLTLGRPLHAAALRGKTHDAPEPRQACEEVHQSLRQTVERIIQGAGKTDADLAPACAIIRAQGGKPQQKERSIDTVSPA